MARDIYASPTLTVTSYAGPTVPGSPFRLRLQVTLAREYTSLDYAAARELTDALVEWVRLVDPLYQMHP